MKSITSRVFLVLVALCYTRAANATPFYRDTFGVKSEADIIKFNSTDLTGWMALRRNATIGKLGFLKMTSSASKTPMQDVNAKIQGTVPAALLWTKPTISLSIITDEFSFSLADLATVEYEQRLDGANEDTKVKDGTRLALLVDSIWYISDTTVPQQLAGRYEQVVWNVKTATFGTIADLGGRGPELPKNSGLKLPASGTVTAFGVIIPQVSDRVRIDNYTLADSSPLPLPTPTPTATPRPGATPPPESVPTPKGGGSEESPEPVATGVFCSGNALSTIGTLSASKSVRQSLLLAIVGNTLTARRDRAILSLLLTDRLRVDSIVNLKRQDLASVGSLTALNVVSPASKTVPLKPLSAMMVQDYAAALGVNSTNAQLPLFARITDETAGASKEALCASEIKRIVKKTARQVGLIRKIKFGK